MKDPLSKIKKQVADAGHGEENSPIFIDPQSRSIAVERLKSLHDKEQKKLDQGFVKKRIPIQGGYVERWVLP